MNVKRSKSILIIDILDICSKIILSFFPLFPDPSYGVGGNGPHTSKIFSNHRRYSRFLLLTQSPQTVFLLYSNTPWVYPDLFEHCKRVSDKCRLRQCYVYLNFVTSFCLHSIKMTNISNETHDTSSRFKQTQKIDDLYCFSFYTVYNVTSFHLYSVVQFRCTLGIHLTYSLSKVRPKDVRSLSTVEVDSVRFLIKRFAITLSSVLDDPS